MGVYTSNSFFYKPDLGAKGQAEKDKFDAALDSADSQIQKNKNTATVHALRHKDGGADELDLAELAAALGSSGNIVESDGSAASWVDPDGRYNPQTHDKSFHDSTVLDEDNLAANAGSLPEIDRENTFQEDITFQKDAGFKTLAGGVIHSSGGYSSVKAAIEALDSTKAELWAVSDETISSISSGTYSGVTLRVLPGVTITFNGPTPLEFNIRVDDGGQVKFDVDTTINGNLESKGNTSGVVAFVSVDSDETLTVNGSIDAGMWQVFGSSLMADLSSIKYPVKAEWFSTLENAQESDASFLTIEDDSWTISDVIEFDQNNTTVKFINQGKVTTTDETKNGFLFSGAKCRLENPNIVGPGTVTQDGSWGSLVHVSGDSFIVEGGQLIDPPSAGLYALDINYIDVIGVTVDATDSISTQSNTNHFGIKIEDFLGCRVLHNRVYNCIQGIKISSGAVSSKYAEVAHNYLEGNFDHCIYGGAVYGENFHHNHCKHKRLDPGGLDEGAGTAIVGQNQSGIYSNNIIHSHGGGITVRNSLHARITDNFIELDTDEDGTNPSGINLSRTGDGDILHGCIENNTITFTSSGASDGIKIVSQGTGKVVSFTKIRNNKIRNPAKGSGHGITVVCDGTGQQNEIVGTEVDNSGDSGIFATDMKNSRVAENIIKEAASKSVQLSRVTKSNIDSNKIIDETGSTTTAGIEENTGCSANSYSFNDFDLSGLDSSLHLILNSDDFNFQPIQNGKSWTLSSSTSFYISDGFHHIVDPGIGGSGFREFNPSGNWPIGSIVRVMCRSGSSGEGVEFYGVSAWQIDDGEIGEFMYYGTGWDKIGIS